MFTGIIEEMGVIESVVPSANGIQLVIRSEICADDLKTGDSLAVNGCCLTVTKISGKTKAKSLRLDLLRETWTRTNLQFGKPGDRVNLERALQANGRLGGHFVTGHIDGTGKILRWEKRGQDFFLEIATGKEFLRYVIFKGSIAIDGISLTIAEVGKKSLAVWIIPHTYEVTALRERKVGNTVNLEADMLGKYVERFISFGSP